MKTCIENLDLYTLLTFGCFFFFVPSRHRVSHCFTDSTHCNVFAFVTAGGQTVRSECHAFLCSKRKMVRSSLSAVVDTLGVAADVCSRIF